MVAGSERMDKYKIHWNQLQTVTQLCIQHSVDMQPGKVEKSIQSQGL